MLALDILFVTVVIFSILFTGSLLEKKICLPGGFGSPILFLGIQQILSITTINPWGSKTLWTYQTISMWGSLIVFSLWKVFKKKCNGNLIKRLVFLSVIGTIFFYFLQPGERTWDGAGYHNVISLLIYQTGNIWNWPNLMWAQWFPAGQETIAASFLVIFSNYNGLIVPTIIWFVLILNLVDINFRQEGLKKHTLLLSLAFVFTLPFVLSQTGTSYVDIQTGMTFMILCYMLTQPRNGFFEKIPLVIAGAGLISSKWSGVALLAILTIFSLSLKKFTLIKRIENLCFLAVGTFFGILPIALRNFIEFGSPTYPFKGPFNAWPGLFPQSLMTNQIGVANQPPALNGLSSIEMFFHEYIYSIFYLFKTLFVNFEKDGFSYNQFDPELLSYISYDARLGGFGLVVTGLVILIIYINRTDYAFLLRLSLLISPLFFFPMNWWARYFIGIPFALIFIQRKSLIKFFNETKLKKSIGLSVLVTFATINFLSFLAFSSFQKASWPSPNGYGGKISSLVSNPCRNILVVGEGLTFSSALWGDTKCNHVVGSVHFGNSQESLGQYGSLPTVNDGLLIDQVNSRLEIYPSLLIVLTYSDSRMPNWASNLVDEIQELNRLDYLIETTESNGHPIVLVQTKSRT